MADVTQFAERYHLHDIMPLLRKAAIVGNGSQPAQYVSGITSAEVTAIRNERAHRWKQPFALFFTIVLCSIGAAVQ